MYYVPHFLEYYTVFVVFFSVFAYYFESEMNEKQTLNSIFNSLIFEE
jgi:hypothetical protein